MKLTGKDYLIGFLLLVVIVSSVFTYKENKRVTKLKAENTALQVEIDKSKQRFDVLDSELITLNDSLKVSKQRIVNSEKTVAVLEKKLKEKKPSPVQHYTATEMDSVFKTLYPTPDSVGSKPYPAWVSITQKQIFDDLMRIPEYDSLVSAFKILTNDYKATIEDQGFIIVNQADQLKELILQVNLQSRQLTNTTKQVNILTIKNKRAGTTLKIAVPAAVIFGYILRDQLQ